MASVIRGSDNFDSSKVTDARPAFSVGFSASYTRVDGTRIDPAWNTIHINRDNIFDTSSSVFTAPVDGLYSFNLSLGITFSTTSSNDGWYNALRKNGVTVFDINATYLRGPVSEEEASHSFTMVLELAAGDTIDIHTGGTTQPVIYLGGYFSGYLIG